VSHSSYPHTSAPIAVKRLGLIGWTPIAKHRSTIAMTDDQTERNKQLVIEAFDTLFNKRDYARAEQLWAPGYVQHSAHIPAGRDGLINLIKSMPPELKHETELVIAEGPWVMIRGRFSGHGLPRPWIVVDTVRVEDGQLAEHWDVIEDEVTEAESVSGLPMFGDSFLPKP
jgi:predicted SnoaL-like aldol condensation-catalyzing enzyme